jgi:hypothetical protein
LSGDDNCSVKAFAEGAFNKLFTVDCSKGRFIFRISLPVAPHVKTQSEFVILAFVRERTDIPVPLVMAYDADLANELDFEWMLMQFIDARPLHEVWHEMSWLKKGLLVMRIAEFQAQLFNIEFSGIGSLSLADDSASHINAPPDSTVVVGEIVQPAFFKGDNVTLDINRGPFRNSQEYLAARLQLLEHFASKLDLEDEDDLEHYEDMQAVLSGVRAVMPRLFPDIADRTILCNHDISTSNILVDPATGDLVSIVDWECVTTLPDFAAVQIPQFLKGPTRDGPPAYRENTESEVYKLTSSTTKRSVYASSSSRRWRESARPGPTSSTLNAYATTYSLL